MHQSHNSEVHEMTRNDKNFMIIPKEDWEVVEDAIEMRKTWVPINAVAKFLHCSIRHIRNLVSRGKFKGMIAVSPVTGLKTFNILKVLGIKK